MEENRIYELLYQQSYALIKKLNRIFLFLFLFPLIYFLLENSLISTIETPYVSIDKVEIIILVYPTVYAALMLYLVIIAGRIEDINKQMIKLEDDILNFTSEIKNLLKPVVFVNEIFKNRGGKGVKGCIGILVIDVPVVIFCLLFPICFLIYGIYRNYVYTGVFESLSFSSNVISIYIFIVALILLFSSIKVDKSK